MLHDELKKLNRYPFHMPGHKRNPRFSISGAEIDITEIEGYDDLHNAKGVILETENSFSKLYGSRRSFLLVNGTTVGILASVFALTADGDKIIMARNCHKSVYNACLLRKLKIVFAEPEFDAENGFYTRLSQKEIDRLISENRDAKAVIITSPTYEGYVSEIQCDLPLLVDAAHGAHFPFGKFPKYPTGDIVISSLHKTLPALTQTAIANVYNEQLSDKLSFYLDIFETSSPSYVLMNSASICASYLEHSRDDFENYTDALKHFYLNTNLHHLKLIDTDDPGKIIVSAAKTDIDGTALANMLRNKYNMEPEAAGLRHIILMTSVADNLKIYGKLKDALEKIDHKLKSKNAPALPCPAAKQGVYSFCFEGETEKTEIDKSSGRICAEFIYTYPPGIPIITPNEIITESILGTLRRLQKHGINTINTSKLLPQYILTKRQ